MVSKLSNYTKQDYKRRTIQSRRVLRANCYPIFKPRVLASFATDKYGPCGEDFLHLADRKFGPSCNDFARQECESSSFCNARRLQVSSRWEDAKNGSTSNSVHKNRRSTPDFSWGRDDQRLVEQGTYFPYSWPAISTTPHRHRLLIGSFQESKISFCPQRWKSSPHWSSSRGARI